MAEQMAKDRVKNPRIQLSCTLPQGEGREIIRAVFPEHFYEFVDNYDESQLVVAAATIAADFMLTAGFAPPAVRRNLDSSATAISSRKMGFRDRQLICLAPWYTTAAVRNGVTFGGDRQLARHLGWYLEGVASDEETASRGKSCSG